jgi:GNAT superfamily N-acetyltransferase
MTIPRKLPLRIRDAAPGDATAACDVLRRSIAELCTADHEHDDAFLARWLANKTPANVRDWIENSYVLVAEENGAIVGVAALTGAGVVTLNYVAPEARFRDASKALMRAVEDKAETLGCAACTLVSTKTAERFYRAIGYRDRGAGEKRELWKPLPGAAGEQPKS